MKKNLLAGVILCSILSCNQCDTAKTETSKTFNLVSQEEYKKATKEEKEIFDKINASIAALEQLKDEDYEASIFIDKDDDNQLKIFENTIIISKENEDAIALEFPTNNEKQEEFFQCESNVDRKFIKSLKESNYDQIIIKKKDNCITIGLATIVD